MTGRSRWMWATVPILIAGVWIAGCLRSSREPHGASRSAQRRYVTSNILPEDYAGSASCAACHARVAERFSSSPMHRMTRELPGTAVEAAFEGAALHLGADEATMVTVDGRPSMRLQSAQHGQRLYQVTKVIGGRYREDFVGIPVAEDGKPVDPSALEVILPVSWVLFDGAWRYKGYSVQLPERPGLRAGPVWSQTCVFCHNTAAFVSTALDDLADARLGYQGTTNSNLLPEDRRLQFEIRDERRLSDAIADEVERLGSKRPDPTQYTMEELLRMAARTSRRNLRSSHLVEVGIGCESCHGGSREHTESPDVLPSYEPRSPLFAVAPTRGSWNEAEAINHVCARCHAVLFSRYPYTWEGGTRRGSPGGSTINSGEARNFLLGGCARAMSCATCHDPHAEDDPQRLAWLATPDGNVTCTHCHESLTEQDALQRHTHHDPRGAGGSCVGCHMPRKNAGLDYALTRYHRIGSPTDRERVENDRPLECALCHLDARTDDLVATMERWWGTSYDRKALRRLYGNDLSVPVLEATLAHGLPHEQTVAIERLGHTDEPGYLDPLVDQLDHRLPLVRYYARESLRRLTGDPVALDMSLPGTELQTMGREWLRTWRAATAHQAKRAAAQVRP